MQVDYNRFTLIKNNLLVYHRFVSDANSFILEISPLCKRKLEIMGKILKIGP